MIFEVACGVVIGGIVLWVLAAFAEPILKALLCIVAVAVAGLAIWIFGEFLIGAWHLATRGFARPGQQLPLPDSVFYCVIGLLFIALQATVATELFNGFPFSRRAIAAIGTRLRRQA
jgi:hypothetical protein